TRSTATSTPAPTRRVSTDRHADMKISAPLRVLGSTSTLSPLFAHTRTSFVAVCGASGSVYVASRPSSFMSFAAFAETAFAPVGIAGVMSSLQLGDVLRELRARIVRHGEVLHVDDVLAHLAEVGVVRAQDRDPVDAHAEFVQRVLDRVVGVAEMVLTVREQDDVCGLERGHV